MNATLDDLQRAFTNMFQETALATTAGDASAPAAVPAAAPAAPASALAPPPASAPPPPPIPCSQLVDAKTKGYHLDASVAPEQVVGTAELLDRHGFSIDTITGVDWPTTGQMEIVYDYFHWSAPWHIVVRTRVPRANPELPTISGVFSGANWHERETHDFFGIRFAGHPNLTPLLLPEDADYHPLRKDFAGAS
jgi:NADH-quinone oxidoreductase subunit C